MGRMPEEKKQSGPGEEIQEASFSAVAKENISNDTQGLQTSNAATYAGLCSDRSSGIPMRTKEDTKKAITMLIEDERPPIANVYGKGPLLLSNVPESSVSKNAEVALGIE